MIDRRPPDQMGNDAGGPSVVAFAVKLKTEFGTPPHCHARGQMIG